mmetsp:Transcript_30971/g.27400  ORF Transcript_30971/g.27400 Transcript_30971/m.27400 type:complete len:160 (+) Transcript_30971:149-628(+)
MTEFMLPKIHSPKISHSSSKNITQAKIYGIQLENLPKSNFESLKTFKRIPTKNRPESLDRNYITYSNINDMDFKSVDQLLQNQISTPYKLDSNKVKINKTPLSLSKFPTVELSSKRSGIIAYVNDSRILKNEIKSDEFKQLIKSIKRGVKIRNKRNQSV